jgi:hypothetical protein
MFSKLDKKILITLVAVVSIILLLGFLVFKYSFAAGPRINNSVGGAQTEIH